MMSKKIIKTRKFTLRLFRMSDADSIVKHANDKLVSRNLERVPYPYTKKDAKTWLKRKLVQYNQKRPEEFVQIYEMV